MMTPRRRQTVRSVQALDSTSVLAGPPERAQAATGGALTSGNTTTKPFIAEGEVLRIDRVSRYDMGYYMCIASNGVPPSVAQRIFLPVSCKFPLEKRLALELTQRRVWWQVFKWFSAEIQRVDAFE